MVKGCPSAATLSAWLDDELNSAESEAARGHLERCAACRAQVIGWMAAVTEMKFKDRTLQRAEDPFVPVPLGVHMAWRPSQNTEKEAPSPARHLRVGEGGGEGAYAAGIFEGEGRGEGDPDSRARLTTCLQDEVLIAYSEGELGGLEEADAEQHLRQCMSCVGEAQRLIHLRMAMRAVPASEPVARDRVGAGACLLARLSDRIRPLVRTLRVAPGSVRCALGQAIASPWPALGAVAATVVLVLVVTRFLPNGENIQFRGTSGPPKVEVIVDGVIAHARPGADQPIIGTLARGTTANWLEESGEWTRVELPDGRRVWVGSAALASIKGATR